MGTKKIIITRDVCDICGSSGYYEDGSDNGRKHLEFYLEQCDYKGDKSDCDNRVCPQCKVSIKIFKLVTPHPELGGEETTHSFERCICVKHKEAQDIIRVAFSEEWFRKD